ncbi:hypothetical protein [Paenibacillus glycanilyticus]|uniref:Uncharacterized protein n=1 Tax=Paenibacillus glycanilyticus TaxID=126569 RepID=A0ABQ6GCU9_9BACL|nr:hypothetical protein [Paenibacillus glycanilyticus]GLX67900.1 hypothetical protein MU1_22450 [Paenibacillus glycanilyticus]
MFLAILPIATGAITDHDGGAFGHDIVMSHLIRAGISLADPITFIDLISGAIRHKLV